VEAVHWCTRSGIAADADKGLLQSKSKGIGSFHASDAFLVLSPDLVLSNMPTLDFLPNFSSASE
jgi:hypothetical protein